MTTKILTAKQVRWMEFLSDFNFLIRYTAGKDNQKADILSRREQDVAAYKIVKQDSRSYILLSLSRLDERINTELADKFLTSTQCTLATLEPAVTESDMIQELKSVNRNSF